MERQWLHVVLAVCASTGIALGEPIITYESYDDATPDDPGIHLCLGCSATIETWLTPTDGVATSVGSGGFQYEGDALNGTVTNGGIVLSDHHWVDILQIFSTFDPLPTPFFFDSFTGVNVPVSGFRLSTMTVTGTAQGHWQQFANPFNFADMNGAPFLLAPGSERFVVFVRPENCDAPGPDDDCNGNHVHDLCDIVNGDADDCNFNGRPDVCDLADGTSNDCNENAIPDECDPGSDCNENGFLDACDLEDGISGDCNENGVPDECDIASNTSTDDNIDGIPDECPLALALMVALDCVGAPGEELPPGCIAADMDRDGDVDWSDLGLLQVAHGGCAVLIFSDPLDHHACAGDSVFFEVRAGGVMLSYQWRFNGEDIPGATDSTLVFDEPEVEDTGLYDCRVTSACGGIMTSNAAEFVVANALTAFAIQPVGATVCEGGTHFMFASASGSPLYQWFKDGEPIAGATEAYFAITNASSQDAGAYQVEANNACNNTLSDEAVVAIIDCMQP